MARFMRISKREFDRRQSALLGFFTPVTDMLNEAVEYASLKRDSKIITKSWNDLEVTLLSMLMKINELNPSIVNEFIDNSKTTYHHYSMCQEY
jgi:DNA mismatch repair ATPase MutS